MLDTKGEKSSSPNIILQIWKLFRANMSKYVKNMYPPLIKSFIVNTIIDKSVYL